ncbi:hypothetical protein CSQ89_21125 [Chitinimonas sp. BJB300]|nr:hypothetical protein CSQ89_21125 [Chitinimonas sp. BJB300]TSJ85611.1 hypothetical protein FG002_017625 [Chitinimonas sp. BJB300]
MDKLLELKPEASGMLAAQLTEPLPAQRWLVQLEDSGQDGKSDWRLRAEAKLEPGASITLRQQAQ